MGFSRQEYWSGLPCPPPGDVPNPGFEPWCPALQVDSLPFEPPGKLGKCQFVVDHGWRRQWHPTPVLLPGKSHGWRSLVGCSPWGREESDTSERLHFNFSLSCIGEGNGNPSSILAWRIPGMGEPGGLPSMGSHRVGHD